MVLLKGKSSNEESPLLSRNVEIKMYDLNTTPRKEEYVAFDGITKQNTSFDEISDDERDATDDISNWQPETDEISTHSIPSRDRTLTVVSVASIALGVTKTIQKWKILGLGQLISFSAFGSGAAASELEEQCGLNAPTFQFGFTYFLLMMHLVPRVVRNCWARSPKLEVGVEQKPGQSSRERTVDAHDTSPIFTTSKWMTYFFLALLELEANFFMVLAYRYTTITSITVLDSIALPSAMVASKILLKWKYGPPHIIGVCICLAGAVLNVISDFEEEAEGTKNKLLGDCIAVVGAIILGVNDSLQEFMCKQYSSEEYLSMLGFFGTSISVVQIYFLEMDEVTSFFTRAACTKQVGFGLLTAFSFMNYFNYIFQAHFLSISEAALMNLCLLTSDLFSVLFGFVVEHIAPHFLFYLALMLITLGIVIYESGRAPMEGTEYCKDVPRQQCVRDDILEKEFQIAFVNSMEFL